MPPLEQPELLLYGLLSGLTTLYVLFSEPHTWVRMSWFEEWWFRLFSLATFREPKKQEETKYEDHKPWYKEN